MTESPTHTQFPQAPKDYPPMVSAREVTKDPKVVTAYPSRYMILYDLSLSNFTFDNLNRAICFLADRGWVPVSITAAPSSGGMGSLHMYALMRKEP